ncbi:MAG: hypothetical protein NC131_14540 [Roseburia sp.]|nr:hypothetical protein [Roseburia sp.]
MKHITFIAAVTVATLTGCKTTEANYRAAYETAVGQREAREADGSVSTAKLQQFNAPRPKLTPEGDTIMVRMERVSPTKIDGVQTVGSLKQNNIVVGQFRQLFNARAMLERLLAGGYPDAFVAQSAGPIYYVVALSSAKTTGIAADLDRVKADSTMKLREPLPFVLCPLNSPWLINSAN